MYTRVHVHMGPVQLLRGMTRQYLYDCQGTQSELRVIHVGVVRTIHETVWARAKLALGESHLSTL